MGPPGKGAECTEVEGGTVREERGWFVLPDERLCFESSPAFPGPMIFISLYPSIKFQQIVIRGAVTKWMKVVS